MKFLILHMKTKYHMRIHCVLCSGILVSQYIELAAKLKLKLLKIDIILIVSMRYIKIIQN